MNLAQFSKASELQHELDQLAEFRNEPSLQYADDWTRALRGLPDERREIILEMIRSELKQYIDDLEAEFERL